MKIKIILLVQLHFIILVISLISSSAVFNSKSPLKRCSQQKKCIRHNQSDEIIASLASQSVLNIPPTNADVIQKKSKKMSLTDLIIDIVADLCPHGMLPLAYGFAQGGPSGLVPTIALFIIFSSMSVYTMISLAKLANSTKSKSAGEVWGKLINKRTEWVVDLAVLALCFGCCIFYSAFIGDIFNNVGKALGLSGYFAERWVVLLSISTLVLLPLCLLEDLSSLHFSTIVGVGGIIYTVGFVLFRLYDQSYTEGGALIDFVDDKNLPEWSEIGINLWRVNVGTVVLANMLCLGFLSQYNAITYYYELENRSEERYVTGIRTGFGIASVVFITMMFGGYFLFGSRAQPLLLNNFPVSADYLATIARVALGAAITFAYPLMFSGLKSSLFSLIIYFTTPSEQVRKSGKPKVKDMKSNIKISSIMIALSLITAIAIKCGEEDVSLILGIVGSVLGCFSAYILPAMLRLVQLRERKKLGIQNKMSDVIINHIIIALGTLFGGLGVWTTIKMQVDKIIGEEYY